MGIRKSRKVYCSQYHYMRLGARLNLTYMSSDQSWGIILVKTYETEDETPSLGGSVGNSDAACQTHHMTTEAEALKLCRRPKCRGRLFLSYR